MINVVYKIISWCSGTCISGINHLTRQNHDKLLDRKRILQFYNKQ